ncbi:unnamed protein product [Sympodiomycopsis kandeliae]
MPVTLIYKWSPARNVEAGGSGDQRQSSQGGLFGGSVLQSSLSRGGGTADHRNHSSERCEEMQADRVAAFRSWLRKIEESEAHSKFLKPLARSPPPNGRPGVRSRIASLESNCDRSGSSASESEHSGCPSSSSSELDTSIEDSTSIEKVPYTSQHDVRKGQRLQEELSQAAAKASKYLMEAHALDPKGRLDDAEGCFCGS